MSTERGTRWGAVAGIAFAILYVIAVQTMDLVEGSYSDQRVQGLFADSDYRNRLFAGAYLIAAAGVSLLWFLQVLRLRLRSASREGSSLSSLAFAAGAVYVAMLFLAGNLWTGYAVGIAVGELPETIDTTLVRVLTNQGFGLLLIYGLFAAIPLILATSIEALKTGALPRWLAWFGVAITPLLLLGAVYVPQFVVPLWVLLVSIVLLVRPRGTPAPG